MWNLIQIIYMINDLKFKKDLNCLKQFLLDNKAYSNYIDNIYKRYRLRSHKELVNYLYGLTRRIPFGKLFDHSLVWSETKEGVDFWARLDYRFEEFYDIYC